MSANTHRDQLVNSAGLTAAQGGLLSGADLEQKKLLLEAQAGGAAITALDGAALQERANQGALKPRVSGMAPATGTAAGGTALTIIGKNFLGATSVNIGGTNCTAFTVVNDTKITCTSAAKGAGTYDVNVVHPTNGTGTLPNGYVYT